MILIVDRGLMTKKKNGLNERLQIIYHKILLAVIFPTITGLQLTIIDFSIFTCSLRRSLAFVAQENCAFSNSIEQNVNAKIQRIQGP